MKLEYAEALIICMQMQYDLLFLGWQEGECMYHMGGHYNSEIGANTDAIIQILTLGV